MNPFTGLGREIHRAWFLTWRIPLAAWHNHRADRLRELAKWHEARVVAFSGKALELADRYPSKITTKSRSRA